MSAFGGSGNQGYVYVYWPIMRSLRWEYPMAKLINLRDGKRRRSSRAQKVDRPSRAETENAVRTLIRWAGDDPYREGLAATPARVVHAYEDWFSGYHKDPREYLSRTFEEISGYDEMVLLRDITFESHCEHHLAPIIGRVHIGYLPRNRVVGISKLARLVDVYARRLQIQEKMTAEIAALVVLDSYPRIRINEIINNIEFE